METDQNYMKVNGKHNTPVEAGDKLIDEHGEEWMVMRPSIRHHTEGCVISLKDGHFVHWSKLSELSAKK